MWPRPINAMRIAGVYRAYAWVMDELPDTLDGLRDAVAAIPEDLKYMRTKLPLVDAIAARAETDPEALELLLDALLKAGEVRGYWMAQSAEWSSGYESFMGGAPDKEPPTSTEESAAEAVLEHARAHLVRILASWRGDALPAALAQRLTDRGYELPSGG